MIITDPLGSNHPQVLPYTELGDDLKKHLRQWVWCNPHALLQWVETELYQLSA